MALVATFVGVQKREGSEKRDRPCCSSLTGGGEPECQSFINWKTAEGRGTKTIHGAEKEWTTVTSIKQNWKTFLVD